MGLGSLGWPEMLAIGFVALVFFGAKRLPEMGRALGKGLREFKNAVTGFSMEEPSAPTPTPLPTTCPQCQQSLEPGARFCSHCGVSIGAESKVPVPAPPDAPHYRAPPHLASSVKGRVIGDAGSPVNPPLAL